MDIKRVIIFYTCGGYRSLFNVSINISAVFCLANSPTPCLGGRELGRFNPALNRQYIRIMISFFVKSTDIVKFEEYTRMVGISQIKGLYVSSDSWIYYKLDISVEDLIALKMMFEIKHSLF